MTTQTFWSGLVTQRSPFNSLDNRVNRRYLGGRPDQLIDGLNVELTNSGTWIRRPGLTEYNTVSLIENEILAFYSFRQASGGIQVMVDCPLSVYTASQYNNIKIFTKSSGAGQTYFQGIGNTLYFGDGVDLQAWQGSGSTRNWGIVAPSPSGSSAELASSGADISFGGNVWTNPSNVAGAGTPPYPTTTCVAPAAVVVSHGGLPPTIYKGQANSDYLAATNYGFSISTLSTISGIQVNLTGFITDNIPTSIPSTGTIYAQLFYNGSPLGGIIAAPLGTASGTVQVGSSPNLWGATINPAVVNSANFGVAFYLNVQNSDSAATSSYTATIQSAQIVVYEVGAPTATPTGSGSFSTVNGGYQYVYAYGNSASGHVSNPTLPSASTGNFGGALNTTTLLSAGSGYAVNDTGYISQGTEFGATYKITSESGGAVTGYTITAAGVGYGVGLGAGVTGGAQPGVGVGFSINVVSVTGVAYVGLPVVASTDPQVNQIRVYRTKDGGSVYYELPTSPYPNTTTTIQDSSPDANLNSEVFWNAIPWFGNSPPPAGMVKLAYHLGRVWGVVGNYVYYSSGPDTLIGNGNEAFNLNNYFQFPTLVNRLVPYSSGLLVFTQDDIWIILGTSVDTFYTYTFQQGTGLLSYNALDVQGSNIFMLSSDYQGLSISSAGINEIGYAIGNLLSENLSPSSAYVASIISGTAEKAVYFSDGVSSWYRCNWNQPPEGGPSWSPKASVIGCQALTQVETAPGVHQLLMGYTFSPFNTVILYRDTTVYTDLGTVYPDCYLTVGSMVWALPGQIAEIESIVLELYEVGSVPLVSILTDEISGTFESLPEFVNDPPDLNPSITVMSNRWYLAQGQNAARMRHMQLRIDYNQDIVRNELLTMLVFGGLIHQD